MNSTPPDLTAYLAQSSEAERELRKLFSTDAPLTFFDVGACEGEDSIRYARSFPRSRLFSFEPLPANQALIRANISRYRSQNVELVPLALSDRAEEATFHVSSGHPLACASSKNWNYGNKSSSLLPPASDQPMYGWIEFKETISVRTETLDGFCRTRGIDKIDFIHLDVQGAEHLVLAGAANMLSRTTAIWLEVADQPVYAGQKMRSEIEQFLRRCGFTLTLDARREIEGDQFYVNRRQPRTWRYLARRRVGAMMLQARRIKRSFTS